MPFILKIIFLVLTLSICQSAQCALTGTWKSHPAMQTVTYSNPFHTVKIIPGERRTYFLVHAQMFYSNAPLHNNTPYLNLFYHDNDKPVLSENMLAVDRLIGCSLGTLIDCAYSPEKNLLFGICSDGGVFSIDDAGNFKRGENLFATKYPGSHNVTGISLDAAHNTAWVATSRGVSSFNLDSLKKENEIFSNHDVVSAAAVGETLVISMAHSDDELPYLHQASLNTLPLTTDGFKPVIYQYDGSLPSIVAEEGTIAALSEITPLTDSTFVFLAPALSGQGVSVMLYSFAENSQLLFPVHSHAMTVLPNTQKANSRYEGYVTPCHDGFNFKLQNFVHIRKGIDPDVTLSADEARTKFFEDAELKIINVESNLDGSDLRTAKGGAWDNADYWFYLPYKGFVRRNADVNAPSEAEASAVWSDTLPEPVVMNAPTVHHASTFAWHPELGMICRQHGKDNIFELSSAEQVDNMSAYKNGSWTPLGLATTNFAQRLVHLNPYGITIDPARPEFIYSGSYFTGILRLNTKNPSDLLRITFGRDYDPVARPFDVKISDGLDIFSPVANAWGTFSQPLFDDDNTLWTAYFWGLDCNRGEMMFCYWKDNDRVASFNAEGENSGFVKWKTLHVKADVDRTNRQILLPLRHKKNKNLLAYNSCDYGSPLVIYDHQGTLENSDDDRCAVLRSVSDGLGRKIAYDYVNHLFEDPVDGRLWFLTQTGLYWINPAEAFDNDELMHRLTVSDASGYDGKTVILETSGANAMCADPAGRKWIGTSHDGIFCLSADNSTLLAHLTAENSELYDNRITALGWNPENNSLMISTLSGIMEFTPAAGAFSNNRNEVVTAIPAVIYPDFTGFVTVSGLTDSQQYEIVNTSNDSVISLARSKNGFAEWDRLDENKIPASPGNYVVRKVDDQAVECRFIIVE